jgi:hypothetical protein
MHTYDTLFFDYIQAGSSRSARTVLPLVLAGLPISSVLDVGCGGRGPGCANTRRSALATFWAWTATTSQRDRLLIPDQRFLARDLAQPFDLARRFDLVQCLEVAEHLPKDRGRDPGGKSDPAWRCGAVLRRRPRSGRRTPCQRTALCVLARFVCGAGLSAV